MSPLVFAAKEALEWLAGNDLRACLIGGLAVQRWGEPRLTQDVDLTVIADYGREGDIIDVCLRKFEARRDDAADFARKYRVLLIRSTNDVDIDVSLGAIPFEIETVDRASDFEFADGIALPTCSAEDLIIHKAIAGRPRDISDIETIVARQSAHLDESRIRTWLTIFADLKEDSEVVASFERAWNAYKCD